METPCPTRRCQVPLAMGGGGGRERVTGIEPATLCLASTRSSQLSYTRVGMGKHLYHTRKSSQPRASPSGKHPVIRRSPAAYV